MQASTFPRNKVHSFPLMQVFSRAQSFLVLLGQLVLSGMDITFEV